MKRNDLIIIILIALTSAVSTYVVSSTFLQSYTGEITSVPTVDKITSTVIQPDETIFNKNAINPSVKISISEAAN